MTGVAAWAYAVMALGIVGFQAALILGAPWGRLTQGGAHYGPLHRRGRIFAALSAVLMMAMALAVLSAAGFWPGWPRWTALAALGVTAASTLANAATRSAPERRLWLPVMAVMLALAVVTVLFGQGGSG